MARDVRKSWEQLAPETIDEFLEDQAKKGRSAASVEAYRRNLKKLYDYLPEDKRLTRTTGQEWKAWMEDRGTAPRSVNACLSALNSLSDFLDRREFQTHDFLEGPRIIQPELTRAEYLRLLQAAKLLEKEQTYLLIKVMGGAGFRVQELPQLTVEAVRQGTLELSYHNQRCRRAVRLPRDLRNELLSYARRAGISGGAVFCSAKNTALSRTRVCALLRDVSPAAQVDAEKATPRCLWNMHQATRSSILDNISVLADQAYERILAEEQRAAGWN